MNKKLVFIGAVVLIVIIAAAAYYYVTVIGPKTAPLSRVDDLHMQMSATSLDELEAIIRTNNEPYTRERAINVYTDIALRSQNPKRALAFLKGLAPDEKNDEVRISAYTNYYFIKNEAKIPPDTTMDVRLTGEIKPGSNVTVILSLKSTRSSARSRIWVVPRLPQEGTAIPINTNTLDVDANYGEGALTNVIITPPYLIERKLPADVAVELPYTVTIKAPGKVILDVAATVQYDNRLDFDKISKKVFLDVGPNSGTYTVVDMQKP